MRPATEQGGIFRLTPIRATESDMTAPRWGTKGPDAMSAATDETVNVNPEIETEEEEIPTTVNEPGKAAIVKEREARKAAAKEARELKAELDALKAKQTEADAEKAKAEEAEAARKGEFEKLANERAESLKTVAGERDTLKAERDELIATLKPGVDAQWKDVPEEIRAFYDGAEDDVIAKSKFLAKSKPAIDKLAATKEEQNERFRKVPTTPRPNGKGDNVDEEARKSQASMYRSF